jgi:hypothetical protein
LSNALGAKGALLAPMLARQWADHLTRGRAFDAAIAPGRFARRSPGEMGASGGNPAIC